MSGRFRHSAVWLKGVILQPYVWFVVRPARLRASGPQSWPAIASQRQIASDRFRPFFQMIQRRWTRLSIPEAPLLTLTAFGAKRSVSFSISNRLLAAAHRN